MYLFVEILIATSTMNIYIANFCVKVFQMTRDGRGSTEGAVKSILKGLCVDDVVALHNYRGQSDKPSLLSYSAFIGCLIG